MIRRAKNTTGEAVAACLKHGGDLTALPPAQPKAAGFSQLKGISRNKSPLRLLETLCKSAHAVLPPLQLRSQLGMGTGTAPVPTAGVTTAQSHRSTHKPRALVGRARARPPPTNEFPTDRKSVV